MQAKCEMLVDRLYIKNYRCFGDAPSIVEFSESGLTALIGPNNVGKSTVLRALEILLGDKWPSGRFSEEDFHNNELGNDIVLASTFVNAIDINVGGHAFPIKGVVVRARHIPTGYGESSIDVDYQLIESTHNLDSLNFEDLDIAVYRLKDGRKGTYVINVGQEIRNQLPIVITVPLIKLQSEQPTNKWGVLGRMLQKVENEFVKKEADRKAFEEKIKDAVRMLRIPEFAEIESSIKTFWDHMRPTNLTGTDLRFLDYEPWQYYRQFKLSIDQNGKDVPIETLGEGVQRLAIIALYRTYLRKHGRHEKAILLVEEPESYLHPQARRTLFHILKQAIMEEESVEGQIIYTTHSEDFIEGGNFDDIAVFSHSHDDSCVAVRHITEAALKAHTIALGQPATEVSNQHIHYRLIETVSQGLKESLFTDKAIIVEGPSEVELFRFFSSAEKEQIGIVSAGGKSNIPAIYSFLTAFAVPCLVVVDRDSEKPERTNEDNNKIVKMLGQEKADVPDETRVEISPEELNGVEDGEWFQKGRLLVFGRNLETVLSKKISGWAGLLNSLRESFNLPTERTKPGPRDIQALGLIYSGNDSGNAELKGKIGTAKSDLDQFHEKLDEFIAQETRTPELLTPGDSEGNEEH